MASRGLGPLFRAVALCCLLLGPCVANCPNHCSGHGDCSTPDLRCSCFTSITQQDVSYAGGDCSLRECPKGVAWADDATATDRAHAAGTMCSNKGICDMTTGVCTCQTGYEGLACHRMSCPLSCNNNGICKSMEYHASTDDDRSSEYAKEAAKHTHTGYGFYLYNGVWDYDKIYGCECDEGYTGYDCSLRYCPTGDDPMTSSQVDEVQTITCMGASPFTITYKGKTTAQIAASATAASLQTTLEALTTIRAVSVSYTTGTTACSASPSQTQIAVTFTQDFGQIPLMTIDSSAYGSDTQLNTMTVVRTTAVTKEEEPCANRGVCDYLTGVCTCSTNFRTSDGLGNEGVRGDCGNAKGQITACPGETACMGHGVCANSPTYRCTCSAGFTGAECSDRVCSSAKAWFDRPTADQTAHSNMECSNMGICDRSKGTCTCNTGFEGGACQYMSCPGSTPCNGHGSCLTMAQRAAATTENGEATQYTYGMTPNYPYTWDYDKVYSCKCDEGYTGYDCSLRACPTGDDPMTRRSDQVHERQYFVCVGTAGTFQLKFREQTTAAIAYNADASTVKAALEALSTIGTVEVTFGSGTEVCAATAINAVAVKFMTELGGAPHVDQTTRKMVPSVPNIVAGVVTGVALDFPPPFSTPIVAMTVDASTNTVTVTVDSRVPYDMAVGDSFTIEGVLGFSGTAFNGNTYQVAAIDGSLPASKFTFVYVHGDPTGTYTSASEADPNGTLKPVKGGQIHIGTTIYQNLEGTLEDHVCSDRGICDYTTGVCACFTGYGSSDGARGEGKRGDCGYVEPYVAYTG